MPCPAAVEVVPRPDTVIKDGRVPTRLADDNVRLQGHRFSEARDLRWAKCGCCSNSIITC